MPRGPTSKLCLYESRARDAGGARRHTFYGCMSAPWSSVALRNALGAAGLGFLRHGLGAIERILPHTETRSWTLSRGIDPSAAAVTWGSSNRRELSLHVTVQAGGGFTLEGVLRRRTVSVGVGNAPRTIDLRERHICEAVVETIGRVLASNIVAQPDALSAIAEAFDESIISSHLVSWHGLSLDLASLLRTVRTLSEQSYENKSLTFACIVDPKSREEPGAGLEFPEGYFGKKRYRALSDGYHTAYEISGRGRLVGFVALQDTRSALGRGSYFPEWARRIVKAAGQSGVAISLTRNGDVLVFDGRSLRFTYRAGRWQYWNHAHLIHILSSAVRVQHVPKQVVSRLVGSVYRDALDVSFRRSGGLFVLLRNQKKLHELVRAGDAAGDHNITPLDREFRRALTGGQRKGLMSRAVLVELAALDGAIVLSSTGQILAYAAVLAPKKRGRVRAEEGSRTKAAVGASNYGLAIKVSSDGDITAYHKGKKLISIV